MLEVCLENDDRNNIIDALFIRKVNTEKPVLNTNVSLGEINRYNIERLSDLVVENHNGFIVFYHKGDYIQTGFSTIDTEEFFDEKIPISEISS